MSLKDEVLGYLEGHREESVSGESLAEQFGVSRSAVWKAIKTLRDEGFNIDAGTNRGYRLAPGSDILTASGMGQYLLPELRDRLTVLGETDSTNNRARDLASAGAPSGTAVVADRQTSGKGRMGRAFASPSGSGIYLSIVADPEADMSRGILITTAAAVATARAVKNVTGIDVDIKWVNDLYKGTRKLCGILCEAVTDIQTGGIENVVIGIGINFRARRDAYPEDVLERIAFLYDEEEPGVTRNRLAAEIINQVWTLSKNLGDRGFIDEYRRRSNVIGRDINYIIGGKPHPARAVDIDDMGGLIIEEPDGTRRTLSSGEISIRWA